MAQKTNVLKKEYRSSFNGGVNSYLGSRQVSDKESPNALNCDFKGKTGVGNRQGYAQIGTTVASSSIKGLGAYKTSSINQLIKFNDDASNVTLYYSTGGAWTQVATNFTTGKNMDVVQAVSSATAPLTNTDGTLFSFNGTDQMQKYNGSAWASHTGATIGFYGAYYDKRLWCVDETYQDTLNFSTQTPDATKPLDFITNGTSSNPGTITFNPGSGEQIKGLKVFQNALYVFLTNAIYKLVPASAANTFTVTLITKSVGCVSHRSIVQVEEDLYFAADDGVYSLGEVANYTSVRTTNLSARMQSVFDNLTGANKAKLCAVYYNFKYHLFYSLFGTSNDSCIVYDVRYKAWQDWRNIPANSAITWIDTTDKRRMFFGESATGKVQEMYSGSTDDGTAISITWESKSFDEGLPDTTKLFMDSTFMFGEIDGSLTISIIFNDVETSTSVTLSQARPQGGFGADAFGRQPFGKSTNTTTISVLQQLPRRIKAKGQKFSIQYRIVGSGAKWRLDSISQTYQIFDHYKFDSTLKLN